MTIVRGDVPTLVPDVPGPVPGLDELKEAINVGLATRGPEGSLVPRIAEPVPTTENGLWKVLADGRIPFAGGDVYSSIEAIDALDPQTLVVTWENIYLQANVAEEGFEFPFPRHLMEPVYESGDIERLLALPYWTEKFIGTGPYRVRSWTVGSGAVLDQFDKYFLGRPKIDTVEVKFIVDPNTIAANLLAGEADVTFGGRLPLDWAQEIAGRSPTVTFGTNSANPMVVYLNLLNPEPSALLQPEFRRALVHALDRETMMNTLVSSLTALAHTTILNPSRGEEFPIIFRPPNQGSSFSTERWQPR